MKQRALILEGGGMRGVFTAGVLDYFLDNNINFPYVVGVSAGCSNALSYLSGQRGRALYLHTTLLENYKYMGVRAWLKSGEFVDNEFLYNKLLNEIYPFDMENFRANESIFEAVATNALSGEACYLGKPQDIEMLKLVCMASGSLPFFNREVMIDGTPMVDGGVADSIPYEHAFSMGYHDIVVVSTQCKGFRKKKSLKIPRFMGRKHPVVVDMLNDRYARYNAQMEQLEELEQQGRAIVIRPTEPLRVGRLTTDTKLLKELYDHGYAAASGGVCI